MEMKLQMEFRMSQQRTGYHVGNCSFYQEGTNNVEECLERCGRQDYRRCKTYKLANKIMNLTN